MIPLFLHPTKIVLLDDNSIFLKNLYSSLPKNFNFCLFDHINEAYDCIKNASLGFNASEFMRLKDGNHLNIDSYDYELPKIQTIFERKERLDVISVIVVDFDMPSMNGIDFLKKISDQKCKKILLTGFAGEKIAVQAFNDKTIDYFVKKEDDNMLDVLTNIIRKAQKEFFQESSKGLLEILKKDYEGCSPLFDPKFSIFHEKLCESNNIVEHYLLDSMGSSLMINASGEKYVLYVQNQDLLTSYYLEVENLDTEIFSLQEKEEIRQGKKMFCYIPKFNEILPIPLKRKPYFCDTKILDNNKDWVYSFQPECSIN